MQIFVPKEMAWRRSLRQKHTRRFSKGEIFPSEDCRSQHRRKPKVSKLVESVVVCILTVAFYV